MPVIMLDTWEGKDQVIMYLLSESHPKGPYAVYHPKSGKWLLVNLTLTQSVAWIADHPKE